MSDFINRPQIEVLSAADGERRRYWSDDDKLRIVEESVLSRRRIALLHSSTEAAAGQLHEAVRIC